MGQCQEIQSVYTPVLDQFLATFLLLTCALAISEQEGVSRKHKILDV